MIGKTEINNLVSKNHRLFLPIILTFFCLTLVNTNSFATTATIQWGSSTGATGYKVYYQTDSPTQPFTGTGATQGPSPIVIQNQSSGLINTTISGLDPSHTYYFAITAYNESGESSYSNVVSAPEMSPPTVTSFTLPSTYTILTVPISTLTATDNTAVSVYCVTLTNSTNGCAWSSSTPTSVTFSSYGIQTAYAWAKDAAGNISSAKLASVSIATDTTNPTVSLTAPINGSVLSGSTTISATASDNSGVVSKVEFYAGTTLLSATNVYPYNYNWNTSTVSNGIYTLTAKAFDPSNNTGTSVGVTVTVNNPLPDTTTPNITAFTLPPTTSNLTVPILVFTATDNVGVTGYCVTTSNSSSGCNWSGTAPTSVTFNGTGNQTAWAWARDAAGNLSASANATTTISMTTLTIGETNILSGDDTNSGDLASQAATLGQTATIQSMSFYVSTASGKIRLGIYDATGSGGGPGKLLASTDDVTPITGWNTVNVTTPVTLSAGTYWLTFLASTQNMHYPITTATGSAKYYAYTYGAFPSNYSSSTNSMTAHWSFYATLVTTDIIKPTITIISPSNNSTISGTVNITVDANDNVGVTKVDFYVNGSKVGSSSTSPFSYSLNTTSLSNGAYTLSAIAYDATNNSGQSSNINMTISNITITSPDAPIIGTATAGNAMATVSFIPPTFDGGCTITSYNVTSSPGNISALGTTSPITVTGLTNGTLYTFTVKATNTVGTGAASAASNSITPATVPGTPTIGTATAGNAQATVSFTAPASNGGSAITSYTVTSSAGQTATSTSSPITVTGLTNGTAYTFTVKATNAIGPSAASAASNSVTPATTPGAPTIGIATAGNAQATVSFTAPSSNGGSPITSYTVTSSAGQTATGTSSPITVTGLTNGTAYTFTVKATNAIGTGTASTASNSVTPATVPGVPTIGTATAGNAQTTVSFTAPSSNGGSPITSYTVTTSTGQTVTGAASPITVTGLTNGTAYTFTVKATNAVGTSAASAASNSVTPATVPSAPTIGTATAGNTQATVSFTVPASNGGSAITSYTVTSSAGQTATGTASPITVTGLANGTAYTFTVKATNAIGTSVASAASNSVTPATVPGAPTIGTATAGNAQATVSFSVPASNGGSTITSYTVTSSAGQTASGTASPITVTGLTNGTAYTFTVKATNAIGSSPSSAASNSVTPVAPSTPPVVSIVTPMNGAKYAAPASIILTAAATASNATITKVEFYNGSTLLKSLTTAPYTFTWSNILKGTYSITAKAYDSNGKTSVSSPVSFTVYSKATGVTFSSISQASPCPVGTSVTFKASASGGSGSYQYQFLVKNPVSGWATTQAYSTNSSFIWNTPGLPTGTYYIQVMARNLGSTAIYEASKTIKYILK
jgi:hypothetical protein